VLIIDDEVDFGKLMRSLFLRKGYQVYVTHTLAEGKRRFKEIAPDYVFYDGECKDFDNCRPPKNLNDL
jgi:DNA-binding response OmpR family regulator